MKKTLKKAMASVMAATIIVGSAGTMNVGATDVTVSFSPSASAYLYRGSTTITATTRCSYYCTVKTAQITSTTGGLVTSGNTVSGSYNNVDTPATVTGYGKGFTSASSYHYVNTSDHGDGDKELTVY
ncbi:MAG: hypothetical protein IKK91_11055 [Ruminococcus sp.]|uniref:hypothetical protein n=1 Tax=Holdemanella sp. TaxID=1971762 RepID=UPI003AEF7775|nr:hypothetical protein [Ruminococcus sp.]